MAGGQPSQGLRPRIGFGEEIRHHRHQATSSGIGPEAVDRLAQIDGACLDSGRGDHPVKGGHQMGSAAAGRDHIGQPGLGDDGAITIAGPGGQEPDRSRGRHRQVPLLAQRGPEVHGRTQVHQRPRLQLSVGDGVTDVGSHGAGRHVPVDPADVVARGVGPGLAEFGTVTGHQALVLAVEQSVDTVRDRQVEPPQHLVGSGVDHARWRGAGRGHLRRSGRRRWRRPARLRGRWAPMVSSVLEATAQARR